MSTKVLQKIQQTVKNLILFDSKWGGGNKIPETKYLPKEVIKKIKTYRELVKNSFHGVIENIYTYSSQLLKKEWNKLLTKYIENYPPSSPILNKVGEHFSKYLSKRLDVLKKYPFISELAQYEWLELEIYEKEDLIQKNKTNGFVLNPVHEICKFEYPIPAIIERIKYKRGIKNLDKRPTNILIYREPKTLNVRFFELSKPSLAYIEMLKAGLQDQKIIELLARYYKVEKSKFSHFEKQINQFKKILKKNRILI